jgi:hypothetical protein
LNLRFSAGITLQLVRKMLKPTGQLTAFLGGGNDADIHVAEMLNLSGDTYRLGMPCT